MYDDWKFINLETNIKKILNITSNDNCKINYNDNIIIIGSKSIRKDSNKTYNIISYIFYTIKNFQDINDPYIYIYISLYIIK
jgi:hypothetical protein